MNDEEIRRQIKIVGQVGSGDHVQIVIDLVPGLQREKAWQAEGLADWAELCETRWHGMKFSSSDRARIVEALTEQGMTQRDIAAVVGVTHRTVGKDQVRGENPPRKRQRQWTPAERDRLERTCVDLYRQGHTIKQVAAALEVGTSTVSGYLSKAGVRVNRKINGRPTEAPSSVDWKSAPTADTGPLYRHSVTLQLVRSCVETLRQNSAENQLARDVGDALAAEDFDWIHQALKEIHDLVAYLNRLQLVIDSDAARHRAVVDPGRLDDVAQLYVVKGA